jgi:TolA-binding protein
VAAEVPANLGDEVAILDRARDALRTGNGTAAMAILNQYANTYPEGALALEARVLRIEALFASGAPDSAAEIAADFLRTHGSSTYVTRVQRLVELHSKR